MRGWRLLGTVLAAALWGQAADAATWVQYTFSGSGKATTLGTPTTETKAVSFTARAYVDLDRHAYDFARGELWSSNGGSTFLKDVSFGGGPATANANVGGIDFSFSEQVFSGAFQTWTATALLGGGLMADGRFPVFSGSQAASGQVTFKLGNGRTGYDGSGSISAVSVARVDAPGTWLLSVGAGPVPEPATWATAVVGFLLLGAGLRYRRKRGMVEGAGFEPA